MAGATEKTAAAAAPKPKQGRSPAYPAISVGDAIDKAKALYDAQGKYPAPMPLAFTAWGYSAKSSGGRDIRAALKYFGLITFEGDGDNGKVKLTDDALRIILDEREDQTEKKAIIRRVALNPAIHKKLLAEFPDGIISDATVEHFLVFDQEYNKSAAGAVVAEFKETASFAGLYKPDTLVVKDDNKGDNDDLVGDIDEDSGEEEEKKAPLKPKKREVGIGMKEDVFSLKEGDVTLVWPESLSADSYQDLEDWTKLLLRKIKRAVGEKPENPEG